MKTRVRDMSAQEIRQLLFAARGGAGAVAEIARDLNVTTSAVSRVITGGASDRIRHAIAKKSKTDIRKIWPSIYLYGEPRKPGRPMGGYKKVA